MIGELILPIIVLYIGLYNKVDVKRLLAEVLFEYLCFICPHPPEMGEFISGVEYEKTQQVEVQHGENIIKF